MSHVASDGGNAVVDGIELLSKAVFRISISINRFATDTHGTALKLHKSTNLFRHPYAGIDYVVGDLGVSRQTAAKYLDELADQGFVEKFSQAATIIL